MKPKVELNLLNRTEAAKYLGVDRGYINLLIEKGEIAEIQLPFRSSFKGRRIPKKTIDDFIDRQLNHNPNLNIDNLINSLKNQNAS